MNRTSKQSIAACRSDCARLLAGFRRRRREPACPHPPVPGRQAEAAPRRSAPGTYRFGGRRADACARHPCRAGCRSGPPGCHVCWWAGSGRRSRGGGRRHQGLAAAVRRGQTSGRSRARSRGIETTSLPNPQRAGIAVPLCGTVGEMEAGLVGAGHGLKAGSTKPSTDARSVTNGCPTGLHWARASVVEQRSHLPDKERAAAGGTPSR
jgi:hypothetical protein